MLCNSSKINRTLPLKALILASFNCLLLSVSSYADSNSDYLFNLSLEQLMKVKVSVGSNVVSSMRKQPVSVYSISKDKIYLSGARTLNELLTLFVPGYFMVEDQDDTIAGFRGLVPDNNSKTLLLLNGIPLNTEWFWGAPDSILNGMDLNYIERIDVIRGPGSVTLGQGALLGAIDIITKKNTTQNININLSTGDNGYKKIDLSGSYQSDNLSFYSYFSSGNYDGLPIRNEGWASQRTDQGLTVYERQHHLKRSDFTNFFTHIKYKQLELDIFHFDQERDLYNFFRDREVVSQMVNGISGAYNFQLNDNVMAKVSGYYTKDDYSLSSHGNNKTTENRYIYESQDSGFSDLINDSFIIADDIVSPGLTMGGTRETRKGIKLVINWNDIWPNNDIAIGAEYTNYNYGKKDSHGNNFIINEEIQIIGIRSNGDGALIVEGSTNENNAWVKPSSTSISSLFLEDFHQVNDNIALYAAFRLDNHSDWGTKISPRIAGFYDIDNKHLFRITWQTGFRGAVGVQFSGGFVQDGFLAQDNFSALNSIAETEADFNFDGIASNDDRQLQEVVPETIENIELAYTYNDSTLKFETVLFYSVVEDILTAQANGYEGLVFGDKIGSDEVGTWNGNWYYQNQTGKLEQLGIELILTYQWKYSQFSLSHAHVEVVDVDEGALGVYVIEDKKNSAYPNDVTRLHISHPFTYSNESFNLQYNHLYHWGYYAPTGVNMSADSLANLGLAWLPTKDKNFRVDFIVKNLWNNNKLYPINGTGNRAEANGTPAVESRSWLLNFSFDF